MHNKTSLFKVNQSRVNPLSEIYIRLQKKKKKYPSHRDNSTFAHSAKKIKPIPTTISPSTRINSKYRSFE